MNNQLQYLNHASAHELEPVTSQAVPETNGLSSQLDQWATETQDTLDQCRKGEDAEKELRQRKNRSGQ